MLMKVFPIKMHLLSVNLLWLAFLHSPVSCASDAFKPYLQTAIQASEGEKQYMNLKSNTNLPQYGECWTQAIAELDSTCAHLTETTQAALAWRFTKCFMDQSMDTQMELCEPDDKHCVENVPERIFQAYTNFFTHTQSICFYLMSQVWHTETEHTISALRMHSHSVSKQLEMASQLQVNLLQQQREGLKVQRQLVEHGLNLSEVLHESRGRLARLTAEFRNSTIEHGRQLGDLFRRLSMLHNWFVGEYTFIEQIIYFASQLFLILIMTTTKRTESARFVLFLVTGVQLIIECIVNRLRDTDAFEDMQRVDQIASIWLIRKMFIGLIVMVYVTMATMYVDSQQLTVHLLKTIRQQNSELLELLRKNTMAATVASDSGADLNEDNIRIQNLVNRDREIGLNSNDLLATSSATLENIKNLETNLRNDLRESVRLRSRRTTPGYI